MFIFGFIFIIFSANLVRAGFFDLFFCIFSSSTKECSVEAYSGGDAKMTIKCPPDKVSKGDKIPIYVNVEATDKNHPGWYCGPLVPNYHLHVMITPPTNEYENGYILKEDNCILDSNHLEYTKDFSISTSSFDVGRTYEIAYYLFNADVNDEACNRKCYFTVEDLCKDMNSWNFDGSTTCEGEYSGNSCNRYKIEKQGICSKSDCEKVCENKEGYSDAFDYWDGIAFCLCKPKPTPTTTSPETCDEICKEKNSDYVGLCLEEDPYWFWKNGICYWGRWTQSDRYDCSSNQHCRCYYHAECDENDCTDSGCTSENKEANIKIIGDVCLNLNPNQGDTFKIKIQVKNEGDSSGKFSLGVDIHNPDGQRVVCTKSCDSDSKKDVFWNIAEFSNCDDTELSAGNTILCQSNDIKIDNDAQTGTYKLKAVVWKGELGNSDKWDEKEGQFKIKSNAITDEP